MPPRASLSSHLLLSAQPAQPMPPLLRSCGDRAPSSFLSCRYRCRSLLPLLLLMLLLPRRCG
uniref:Uncharacterized protein n=1 Tax=Oryza nivara TaxID=4536 RepID=A0A0E0FTA0_ORYNI